MRYSFVGEKFTEKLTGNEKCYEWSAEHCMEMNQNNKNQQEKENA